VKQGFTLIELLVVVGIMAFLGVAATGGYNAMQRGMAERGAVDAASSILKAAHERALVDRSPTVVFCYNRLIREPGKEDENAIAVGEAVAVRRAGRVTWAQNELIVDEFADFDGVYEALEDESDIRERKGMRLWRFDDREMYNMQYSIVADAVLDKDFAGKLRTFDGWANGDAAGNSNLPMRVYAFYNLKKSDHEPGDWKAGQGYGFEFASLQLPHDFVFDGNIPTKLGDVAEVKAFYFDPDDTSANEKIMIYRCVPNASGMPQKKTKAGEASGNGDGAI